MNTDNQISALSRFILIVKRLLNETHEENDRSIYEMYLAKARIILGKVEQSQGIGDDISSMEHLFGNTWLKGGSAYDQAYSAWDEFKGLLTQSIHGMTVNERLFTLGLMDEFDNAVERKSEARMRSVLSRCFLTQDNIQTIIDHELQKNK